MSPDPHDREPSKARVSRRHLAHSAAWAVPAVALGVPAPAMAASQCTEGVVSVTTSTVTVVDIPDYCMAIAYDIRGGDGAFHGGVGVTNTGWITRTSPTAPLRLTLIAGMRGLTGNPQFTTSSTGGTGYGNGGSTTYLAYNVNGGSHSSAGGGGGGSAILLGNLAANAPLVVAGGGGGGASNFALTGGSAFYPSGQGISGGLGAHAAAPGTTEDPIYVGFRSQINSGAQFSGTDPSGWPAGSSGLGATGGAASVAGAWLTDAAGVVPTNAYHDFLSDTAAGGNHGTGNNGGGDGGHGNQAGPTGLPSWNPQQQYTPGGAGGGGYAGGGGGGSLVAARTDGTLTGRGSFGMGAGAGSSYLSGGLTYSGATITPAAGTWVIGTTRVAINGTDGHVTVSWA